MDAQLVVADGGTKKQTIRLRAQDTIIGRRLGSDVRIPSSSVSRRHCRLYFSEDVLSVEDLASANGTFVNGERIHKIKVIRPGDTLQIGVITFIVKYRLSEKGRARIKEEEGDEVLDVETLDLEEVAAAPSDDDIEDAIPMDDRDKHATVEVGVTNDKAGSKGGKKALHTSGKGSKKNKADSDEEPPVDSSALLEKGWKAPAGDNLRDILSKLEDDL